MPDFDRPILALDTSTSLCSLAIGNDQRIWHEWSAWAPRAHSELLHPAVAAAFAALGWSSPAAAGSEAGTRLDCIAVTTGPGSFTGLRIGIAAAKGLSHAWGLPLLGLPTLQVMAWGLMAPGCAVAAAIPSRRADCYAALFSPGDPSRGLPTATGEIVVAPADEALASLLERFRSLLTAAPAAGDPASGDAPHTLLLCGQPWRQLPAMLATVAGSLSPSWRGQALLAGEEHDWPRGRDLAGAAAVARRGGRGGPPEGVLPQYVRRPGLGGVVDDERPAPGITVLTPSEPQAGPLPGRCPDRGCH